MKRHEMLACVSALLVALMAGSLTPAQEPDTGTNSLRKEIRELKDELATLRKLRELDSKLTAAELRLMSERLDRIEKVLQRFAPSISTRGASAFDPVPVLTGAIRLDNRLAVTAYVTIDGVMYSVPPFSTRTLRNRPAGMIAYEVTADGYGIRPAVRTPVTANETLTLTIY